MDFPKELRYSENDEWIKIDDELGTIGITDWAQEQLSDIVFVEIIPEVGETLNKGDSFAVIESVKAAADVYMPVSGELHEVNEELVDTPEEINNDPYGKAWLVKIKISDAAELEELLDSAAYETHCKERE